MTYEKTEQKNNVHEHCLLVDNGVCGELIILLLGGQCSFYLQTFNKSRF